MCVYGRLLQLGDLCGRNWPCLCSAVKSAACVRKNSQAEGYFIVTAVTGVNLKMY
jgi:hypothetical protein